ncbi:hypothetical protein GCM10023347_32580 [Streptomyces chumphonensis]
MSQPGDDVTRPDGCLPGDAEGGRGPTRTMPLPTGRGIAELLGGRAQYQWLACQNSQAPQGLP